MQDDLNIQDPSGISDFADQVQKNKAAYQQAIKKAYSEIQKVADAVQERLDHWVNQVNILQRLLEACYQQEDADCSGIEAELNEALENQQICEKLVKSLQSAIEKFGSNAESFANNIEDILGPAISYLNDIVDTVTAIGHLTLIANYIMLEKFPAAARSYSRYHARKEEIELVQKTGSGTRDWTEAEKTLLRRGSFPLGYQAHHIQNLNDHPDLAFNQDNIRFFTPQEHLQIGHQGDFRNASYGKLFNRRSMMIQRNIKKESQ